MRVLGNILWIILGGLAIAIGWALVGLILCISIIGIPLGIQAFKMAGLTLTPFGKTVQYGGGVGSALANILWVVLVGWWMALGYLGAGVLNCITIIGIPFGLQSFKMAKLAASVAPAPAIFLNAQFEADLTELDEADAREMLADAGLEESGLDQLARVGYDTLGLSTFLTAGEKEVRAWQIHKGYTAPQAAGVIHTDFEKGFIKADIVSYDDFVAAEGSMVKIKEEGKLRQEGRDYVMQDGDIVEFKFNVSK